MKKCLHYKNVSTMLFTKIVNHCFECKDKIKRIVYYDLTKA